MFRRPQAFLQNKVAKRVFTLFVLSAVVPLAVTVVFALWHLGGVLQQLGYRDLAGASKTYGLFVFERLSTLEGITEVLAGDIGRETSPEGRAAIGARLHLRAVRMAPAAEIARLSADSRRRLDAGATVIRVVPEGADAARVVLLRRTSRGVVWAEPDPHYLWGEADALPYLTDICVLDAGGRELFCSRPIPASSRALIARDNPSLTWREDGQDIAASAWTLFLGGSYEAQSWTIVASRPTSALLAPLDQFWAIILPATVVSLLLVVLLTVVQVRRRLIPLEQLTQATRRIGSGDFSTQLEIATGDEFQELAQALNSMASRLGRQFSALTTWSEADRLILTDPNIDRVIETVLKRLPDVVPADALSITVVEDRVLGRARVYALSATDRAVLMERAELADDDFDLLMMQAEGAAFCLEGEMPRFLGCMARLGAHSVCMLPVVLRDSLVAVVALGYRHVPALNEDDRLHARNVADRVALVLSAAEREQQLYQQAHFDPLTGLPNRVYIEERLRQAIVHLGRQGQQIAVLFIDLDRFKGVNDILGHAAGDDLLRQAAARLRGCVREADAVARLGGDEFAIVLTDIPSPRAAQIVAENVIRVLSEPIVVSGRETFVTCSIGVTIYPGDGLTGEELLGKADTAMYRAKQNGRGRYVFFEERMNVEALERVALEQDLRRALGGDEFVLHFQPQIDLRSGTLAGAEVLMRWAHPSRGLLGPDQFIPLAEHAGLIEDIGERLLRKACAQHSHWRKQGLAPGLIAVNVSTRQLKQANFWDIVRKALAEADMAGSSLELEITESLLLEDAPEVVANFSRLVGMGVKITVDDFGTGYSSFAYLKRLPIHAVKIDRAFMRDVPDNEDACTLAATIIAMARSLKKDVIAEGVETENQIAFLRGHGCHLAQGFYLCRPLPATDFAAFMQAGREDASVRAR